MNVGSSTNQYSASSSLMVKYSAEPNLNERSVKFVNSEKDATRHFIHRVSRLVPWRSLPNKTLKLSDLDIEFANPTNAIQRLVGQIRCHISPPDPLDRKQTLGNKKKPCDLKALSIPSVDESKAGPPGLNSIRVSASRYGGKVVFKFSQSKGEFNKEIALHSETKAGVCKALCDHWMVSHANGLSLFDGLYIDGQKGQFNINMLTSIKQLYIDADIGDGKDQIRVSSEWLARHGLERGTDDTPCRNTRGLEAFLLLSSMISKGHYKVVHLIRNNGGHAMIAHTTEKGKVRFFDPNYGDFKFSNSTDFKAWFKKEFWPHACYTYETLEAFSYTATHAS